MPDEGPANPPPNPNDPWLEGLTFEQLAQLVNEVSPDAFYLRASAFDQAGGRLQDVVDLIRHELNHLREVWTGKGSEEFDALASEVTGRATVVLQFLQNPGYGAMLRNAGNALADHQRRFRDLQGQKAQQESTPPPPGAPPPEVTAQVNNDSAKQILRDLRTAYWDIGNSMSPLPFKAPQVVVDPNGSGGSGSGDKPPVTDTSQSGPPDTVTSNGSPNLMPPMMLTALGTPPPGQSGGGPSLFGTRSGQVLGRNDPVGQDQAGHQQGVEPGPNAPVVLGQGCPPATATFAGMPGVAVPPNVPAVLGRSEKKSDAFSTVTRTDDVPVPATTVAGKEQRKVEEKRQSQREKRPETVSSEAIVEPDEITVRTAVDAPEKPALVDAKATEIAGQVVTADGRPLVPEQATPEPGARDLPEETLAAAEPDALTKKPLSFTGSADGGGGSQHAAMVALDPQARGMFAPTASPDALLAVQPPAEPNPAGPGGSGRGAVDPYAPQQMGGMPMSPMLGGMSTQGPQQNGRMAAMPNEPRPEVWDPSTDAPIALGRREPEPAAPERVLSKEDIQARLAEKFAELDRLTERGK